MLNQKEDRKSLNKLFDMVEGREVEIVITGFKDRLTRLGFKYLEFQASLGNCMD